MIGLRAEYELNLYSVVFYAKFTLSFNAAVILIAYTRLHQGCP
jgi:hypothetical protein